MSVLVTPGDLRSALAVTRSLGRRGVPVTVADPARLSLARASRHCHASIRVDAPDRSPEAFVAAVRREVERGGHRVVVPVEDVSLSVLSRARSRFDGLSVLPFPEFDTIQAAHDKAALASLAREHGIPVPKTAVLTHASDLGSAIRDVGLPAVVKPRFSRVFAGGRWTAAGAVRYVHTAAEVEAAYRDLSGGAAAPLLQEFIPGEGRGVFVLMNGGQLRAAFAHRRLREKPPAGGVSVLSESVELDPQLLQHCERLFHALKWHGVAMAEFKRDARSGACKLLEINGRFWGSLQLAVDAGVDFPYLLYRLAVDGDVAPVFQYRIGVRLRWWLGDLDWLLLRLREPRGLVGHVAALVEFLRSNGPTTRAEILRRDDPAPAALELARYLRDALRGATGRVTERLTTRR